MFNTALKKRIKSLENKLGLEYEKNPNYFMVDDNEDLHYTKKDKFFCSMNTVKNQCKKLKLVVDGEPKKEEEDKDYNTFFTTPKPLRERIEIVEDKIDTILEYLKLTYVPKDELKNNITSSKLKKFSKK